MIINRLKTINNSFFSIKVNNTFKILKIAQDLQISLFIINYISYI